MIKFKTFLHKKVTQKEKELGTPQRTKRFEDMTLGQVEEISRSTAISYLNKAQDKSRYFSDPNRLETRLKSFTLAQKKIGQSKDKPKIMAKNKSKMVAEKDYTAELEAQKKRQEEERNLRGVLERHYPDSLNHSEANFPKKDLFNAYTQDSSNINQYHWNNFHNKNSKKDQDLDLISSQLDSHLNNNLLKKNQSLYSGVGYDPRKYMDKEGIVSHPAYLSTSKNIDVARHFALDSLEHLGNYNHSHNETKGHILHIHAKKGQKGLDISRYSDRQEEGEVLFPRNIKMKYLKTEPHSDKVLIHHMELIHE